MGLFKRKKKQPDVLVYRQGGKTTVRNGKAVRHKVRDIRKGRR